MQTATRVSTFYDDYIKHAKTIGDPVNIMPRDATQILAQMANQTLYVCEQVNIPEPDIVAASILWDYEEPVPSNEGYCGYDIGNFLEIGTQVSVLPGFQLQWIMTAVILLERLAYDPHGTMCAATYGDNLIAPCNFTKMMRFVDWNDVPATLKSLRNHHLIMDSEQQRGVKWFRPTIGTVNAAATLVLDIKRHPCRAAIVGRAGTYNIKEIEFEFDHTAFERANFDEVIQAAERIDSQKPVSLDSLKFAIQNESISPSFIEWV